MPKVFYGSRSRSVTPPSTYASDDSGSEASTDIEVSRRRPAHRRGESIDAAQPDPKRARTRTARDAQGRRALQKACQRNDMERVRAALAQHADIEDRDYAGTTALHDAALNGNAEIVGLLLQSGAVVDVRSGLEELDTPLMDAAAAGSVEVTRLLVDAGADPRISNAVGKTAVDFVDEDDESAAQIIRLLDDATRALRAAGAPIIDAPTHASAPPNLFPPGYEARKRTASTNFIDVTRRTGRGIRADAVAHAAEGNLAFVGLALERGWTPTAEALVKAAKFGHQDVVGLLLAFGLDADAAFEGQTALKAAVQRGHVATAQLLLQSGSRLDRKDSRGRTYRDLVADLPPTDPMRVLIEGSKPGATGEKVDGGSGEAAAPKQTPKADATVSAEPEARAATSAKVARERRDSTGAARKPRVGAHVEGHASADQKVPLPNTQASIKRERTSSDRAVRSSSDGSRHKPERLSAAHPSPPAPPSSTADSSSGTPSSQAPTPAGPSDARNVQQRVSSRSESRPGAFRLADLRAIKPKKRSKSAVEPELVKSRDDTPPPPVATGSHGTAFAPGVPSDPAREEIQEAAPAPAPAPAHDDAPPHAAPEAAAGSSSPVASASPAAPRESPVLSPLTDAPAEKPVEKPKRLTEDSPKWIERSNELAELARRREKQRLAREARMLESLANEERRRSQEPHSPAAQSPASEPSSDNQPLDTVPVSTQSAPAVLTDSAAPKPVVPVAASTDAPVPAPAQARAPVSASAPAPAPEPVPEPEPVPVYASVKHLPFFLRQLSYKAEPQNVGPLFVHLIGTTPYYLDVQLAAHAGIPQLHLQYPQWPKVLVTDAHKPALWSFCRPWAVGRSVSDAVLAAEAAAFTSLPLAWVPTSIVDETLFRGTPPSTVKIRLDPPRSAPKWSDLISDTELPLRLQFRATLLRRLPEW